MQTAINQGRRNVASGLLSLTRPNRELFYRQRAMLRGAIPAGFPSPADDCVEQLLSLDEHLITHRESTFFMRVAGDSMRGLGIFNGDLLVVDRAVPVTHGCIVIAAIDGEFTIKQLLQTPGGTILRAAHPDYADLHVRPEHDFTVWGVVRWNVHKL